MRPIIAHSGKVMFLKCDDMGMCVNNLFNISVLNNLYVFSTYMQCRNCMYIMVVRALWCGPRIASLPLPRYVVRGD